MKSFNIFLLLIFSGMVTGSHGADFKTGETVEFSGSVNEDFYAGAGRVTVTSSVAGDAIIGGGDVSFKGKVSEDVLIIGGKVSAEVTGADDIRIIGGEVDLTSKNSGDVFVAGGDIHIMAQSVIRGDLYVAGGMVTLDGQILGNVFVYAGEFNHNGKISRNLFLRSETAKFSGNVSGSSNISSTTLSIKPEAAFSGSVEYWSQKETNFNNATAVFNEELKGERDYNHWGKQWIWFAFLFLGFALLTIALIVVSMPKLLSESANKLLTNPASAMGYGVMYYLLVPVFVLFLIMTVLGFVHGLFIGVLYAFSLCFSGPFTSVIILNAILMKYKKTYSPVKTIFASLGVYFLMLVVMGIPFAGFILNLLIVSASTGAVAMTSWERYKQK